MNDFVDAARDLIGLNGVSVTYISVTEGAYDPSTGTIGNSEVSTSVIAYPKGIDTLSTNYPNLVGRTETEFLIVAQDLPSVPAPQDKITRGSEVMTVESYREVIAGGVTVIYKILAVK